MCLGLAALLFAPACASNSEASVAPPGVTEVAPEPLSDPAPADDEELGDEPLANGDDQVMTFDGMDAEPGAPEQVRAAPQREPIGRFKLFGEGPG